MKVAMVIAGLVALLGFAWWMHHIGYLSGLAYQKQQIDQVQEKISTVQTQCTQAVAKAKTKQRKAEARADRLSKDLSAKTQEIQSSLSDWMTQFEKKVNQCSVAKQPLCPGLRDY